MAMITYTIPGARTLDQLSEPTFDGHPDENASDNCVATSIAEGLNILDTSDGAVKYVGDELHDAVYGQGYVGFQSASRYVGYCANAGVTLRPVSSSQAGLIATIHNEVAAGHPVVVTMPSQWSVAPLDPVHPSGTTHVGLAVGVGPGAICVMNPWHGFMQDATDDWWAARLCEGQVWVMQRSASVQKNANNAQAGGSTVTTAAATGGATSFYGLVYTSDAEMWACPSTGHSLGHGFLRTYQGLHGPDGQSATELLGLPISDEYTAADGKTTRQDFERGSLVYNGQDRAPWQIYFAAIGTELANNRLALTQAQHQADLDAGIIAQQQARINELEGQVAAAQQQAQSLVPASPVVTPEEIARVAAKTFAQAFTQALAAALSGG